jgi:gliding motility-associated-like protein
MITQPTVLKDSITIFTDASCFAFPDGSATVGVTGGVAPYTYVWNTIPPQSTAAGSNLLAGNYTVTVSDANLCTTTATVSIMQPPALTVTATGTGVTCFGLSTGSATATATGGTSPYTYAWSTNPPQLSLTGFAVGLAAGQYTAGVQDSHGCEDTVSITITEPPVLKDSITTSTNVSCYGLHDGIATAGVKGGTGPYLAGWSNNTSGYTASSLAAGTYTFGVQDAHGCQDTVSVSITQPALLQDSSLTFINDSCNGDRNGSATAFFSGGTLPYTYAWTPSGGNSNTAANLAAGIYTVTATDGHACRATASVTIHQPPVLNVTSSPKLICISNTATLTAMATGGNTVQPYGYLWSANASSVTTYTAAVSPVVTSTYSVAVTDIKGCKDSVSVTVSVRDSLKFLAVSPSVERCPGFSAGLNATGSGGDSTFSYVWNPGGLVSQNITVSPAATAVYTVTLSDACGTPPVTAIDSVTINPLPQINFTVDQASGCYPLCVQFTNSTTINPSENITYSWNLGAGYTSLADSPLQCYKASGVYSVSLTATSAKGCISQKAVADMITVYPHPKASFSYSPEDPTIIAPAIQFTDASTAPGSSISGLLWQSFGDGSDSTSMLAAPAHTYRDTGSYCVTLIATNALGCKDTVTECLVIKPYFTVYIPNTFTPNGDGRNEEFNISGEYISSLDMKIYDRWGSLIFHSTNISNGWTGSKGATAAQEDVYVYIINVTDPLRNPYSYKGTVTLIR